MAKSTEKDWIRYAIMLQPAHRPSRIAGVAGRTQLWTLFQPTDQRGRMAEATAKTLVFGGIQPDDCRRRMASIAPRA